MASTPMLLSAAMLARALTSEGGMLCETPWREIKATSGPGTLGASAVGGRVKIDRADEGVPQGWRKERWLLVSDAALKLQTSRRRVGRTVSTLTSRLPDQVRGERSA